jgi:hypothetical protein
MMRDWVVNLTAAAGAGLVVYGLWLIYAPLAFVAGGAALIVGAVAMARGDEYRKRTSR